MLTSYQCKHAHEHRPTLISYTYLFILIIDILIHFNDIYK